ncbi:hypothetical protein ACFQZ2_04275 [Streptomonospora algeriensis]|uniref:Uncharacterized protein n=1 Tax=Streptomonospora algeriensis TaxID=995084 RepID=A0ABW3BEA6_9ACTN
MPLQRLADAITAALAPARLRDSDAVADAWSAGSASAAGNEEGVFEEVLLRAGVRPGRRARGRRPLLASSLVL